MRLLITGGAGFIGVALCRYLDVENAAQSSLSLAVLDNLHSQIHPGRVRPSDLPERVQFFQEDVCDKAAWIRVLEQVQPEVIVHLAAETGTFQSLSEARRHTDVNVSGVGVMLEALSSIAFRPKRFVLTSSRAVYGEGTWLDPEDGKIFAAQGRNHRQMASGRFSIFAPSGRPAKPLAHAAQDVSPAPTSIYGATKLAQEHILSVWARAMDVDLTILRLQNVYGPGQSVFNSHTGILTLFHRTAAVGKTISVYEDGQIGRDFIYIDDVVRLVAASAASSDPGIATYDVGSGFAITILEAAQLISGMYNAPEPKITGKFRDGDVRFAQADAREVIRVFGSSPSVNFATGNKNLSNWLIKTKFIS
jgi:dTDP-L-rhamnose 4-epimerase